MAGCRENCRAWAGLLVRRAGGQLLLVCGVLAVGTASALTVDAVVQRLQSRYETTKGFQAEFFQEVTLATLGEKIQSHGRVFFQRPGKMRWEFHEPDGQLLIADGQHFWFYQPSHNQVIRAPLQVAFRSTTPASFLLGMGRIDREFTVLLEGEDTEAYLLRLTPKEEGEEVGGLRLRVSKESFDITEAAISDPLGNVTRVRFSHVRYDGHCDDRLFHFTVPKGVDIIDAPLRR